MKPYDAKTQKDRGNLARDNFPADADRWSILLSFDGVSLHAPNGGGYITIPRKQFNMLVDWYLSDQKPVKPKRSQSSKAEKENS